MAKGRSDFTQIHTFPQTEVPGPGVPQARRQMPAFPVSGTGPGCPDRHRQRYAWLYDDEDIWGADSANCVPPAICGDDWQAPRA